MRLKKHIILVICATLFFLVGLGSVIYHFCLKNQHSVICYFITAGILITLALGAIYIYRGYQKEDKKVLKTFLFVCGACVIAELVYCVELAKTYPIFSKVAIILGAGNVAILSALFFGKDSPKRRSFIFCGFIIATTVGLLVSFMIIARDAIFVKNSVSEITTLLDLVNGVIMGAIVTICEVLKFKDKDSKKIEEK